MDAQTGRFIFHHVCVSFNNSMFAYIWEGLRRREIHKQIAGWRLEWRYNNENRKITREKFGSKDKNVCTLVKLPPFYCWSKFNLSVHMDLQICTNKKMVGASPVCRLFYAFSLDFLLCPAPRHSSGCVCITSRSKKFGLPWHHVSVAPPLCHYEHVLLPRGEESWNYKEVEGKKKIKVSVFIGVISVFYFTCSKPIKTCSSTVQLFFKFY